VSHGKPHPELYEAAMKKMGYSRNDYLAIEDSVNGVKSAKAAGIEVWGFTGGRHLDAKFGERLIDAGASRVIEKISFLEVSSHMRA
jgi:beta-phosphoglucomutase-like phosphatase (HAD superfamily)